MVEASGTGALRVSDKAWIRVGGWPVGVVREQTVRVVTRVIGGSVLGRAELAARSGEGCEDLSGCQ